MIGSEPISRIDSTWLEQCRHIAASLNRDQWRLGDHLIEAPSALSDRVIADDIGIRVGFLRDVRWLCRSFQPDRRRAISRAHHRIVASLPVKDADTLLDQAVSERWTIARLKRERDIFTRLKARAEKRPLSLDARAWKIDAARIEHACNGYILAASVAVRSIEADLGVLAAHPGRGNIHKSHVKGLTLRLQQMIDAAAVDNIDLNLALAPLLAGILDPPQ